MVTLMKKVNLYLCELGGKKVFLSVILRQINRVSWLSCQNEMTKYEIFISNFFIAANFLCSILTYAFKPSISISHIRYHSITKYDTIISMMDIFEIENYCKGNKIPGLNYTIIRKHNANSISFQETSHRNESDQIYFVCQRFFLLALSN